MKRRVMLQWYARPLYVAWAVSVLALTIALVVLVVDGLSA